MAFKHKWINVALITSNTLILLLTIVFSFIANKEVLPGVFITNQAEFSDKYNLEITPAGWTFSIWGFIYTAQILFCGYTLSLICRKGIKNYLYLSPKGLIPNAVYICYIIANIANITWIVVTDNGFLVAGGILLAVAAISLITAIGFAMNGLKRTIEKLEKNELGKEIWLHRIFVQNCLSFYSAWVSVATILGLGLITVYVIGVPQEDGSTICLALLLADLIVWFCIDIFYMYRYSNYEVMPYVVVIVALSGIVDKNFVAWNRNSVFSVILLIVAIALFIVKIIVMFLRHFKIKLPTTNK